MLWQVFCIQPAARRGSHPHGQIQDRAHAAGDRFVPVLPHTHIWAATPAAEMGAILAHESSHIAHRHSLERIVMETMKAALWWNPSYGIPHGGRPRPRNSRPTATCSRAATTGRIHANDLQAAGYSPEIANGLRNSLTKKREKNDDYADKKAGTALLRLAGTLPAPDRGSCAHFQFTTRRSDRRPDSRHRYRNRPRAGNTECRR